MDDIVKAALKKWPNVPHCYGWLALDARGDWYMRDERIQAAGPFPRVKGSRIHHDKLLAFILSAALSGLAGATKALVFQLASLTDVHWSMSGEVVLMTLLGGMGTVFGPVVGAAVIITMQNYLAQLGAWVTVVQGVIFVVCVLAFRRGIVGELGAWLKKSL